MQSNRFWHISLDSRRFNSIFAKQKADFRQISSETMKLLKMQASCHLHILCSPVASLFRSPPPFRERIKVEMLRIFQFALEKASGFSSAFVSIPKSELSSATRLCNLMIQIVSRLAGNLNWTSSQKIHYVLCLPLAPPPPPRWSCFHSAINLSGKKNQFKFSNLLHKAQCSVLVNSSVWHL
jgi:hypothetical protein